MFFRTIGVLGLIIVLVGCSSIPRRADELPALPPNAEILAMAEAAMKNQTSFSYIKAEIDSVSTVKVFPEGYDYVACLSFHYDDRKSVLGSDGFSRKTGKKYVAKSVRAMMFRYYDGDGWIAPLFKDIHQNIGTKKVADICPKQS